MATKEYGVFKHLHIGVRMIIEIGNGQILTVFVTPSGGDREVMVYDSVHKPNVQYMEEMHTDP